MMYTRASASDFDDWEKKFNNPGWGSDVMVPMLQKVRGHSGFNLVSEAQVRFVDRDI